MSDAVQNYLSAVLACVKCQEVHTEVRLELEGHILDRAAALHEAGLSAAEAEERAIRQMGDPELVGQGLDRAHRPRTEWTLMAAGAGLLLVGLWMMYAVSTTESYGPFPFFQRQLLWSVAGIGIAAVLFFFDYRRLRQWGWPLIAVALLQFPMTSVMNVVWKQIWLDTATNPMIFVPGLAALYSTMDWRHSRAGWIAAALCVVPTVAYHAFGGYRHIPSYLALWVVLTLLSGLRIRQHGLALVSSLAGVGLSLLITLANKMYVRERLLIWLWPGRDPFGAGFVAFQLQETLKVAGMWGRGPLAPLSMLPSVHTDQIFAYLIYTLGWVGGGAVCFMALFFLLRLVRMARKSSDRFGLFLVAGICAIFAVQFVWSFAMTVGWAPIISLSLPFFSFGRQQMVYIGAVGLALSVFRRKDLSRATELSARAADGHSST